MLLVSSLASVVQGKPRSHTPGPRKELESHNYPERNLPGMQYRVS